MKAEDKLIKLHGEIVSSNTSARKSGTTQLDPNEVLDAVEEALIAIQELKDVVLAIKDVVKGVKWYEFLKLTAIIPDILRLIKGIKWSEEEK